MQSSLFADQAPQPLAARLRPACLADYVGQPHLVGAGKPLRAAIEQGQLHSMILWGPPGVGKTTFARLLAQSTQLEFTSISAVLSGVKDIRDAVANAKHRRLSQGLGSLLFVDEVHRFNKGQQDAFLPHIEDGTFIFVGATTENPAFELNSALLSRARVYVLKPLEHADLVQLLKRALISESGFAGRLQADDAVLDIIAHAANGDARKALNILEVASDLAVSTAAGASVTQAILAEVLQTSLRRFDKGGDIFYDQISALHKSVRGSDADAALYWLCRMLDGGCDPLYLARRLVRIASEDIGNADPRALQLTLDAWNVQERLGSPEGELALAQAVIYLALTAKSNAVYTAYNACRKTIEASGDLEVPMHLRNAPTQLQKELGHGRDYRYAHDERDAFAAGETYLPSGLFSTSTENHWYHPTDRGLEAKLAEKMAWLAARNREKSS